MLNFTCTFIHTLITRTLILLSEVHLQSDTFFQHIFTWTGDEFIFPFKHWVYVRYIIHQSLTACVLLENRILSILTLKENMRTLLMMSARGQKGHMDDLTVFWPINSILHPTWAKTRLLSITGSSAWWEKNTAFPCECSSCFHWRCPPPHQFLFLSRYQLPINLKTNQSQYSKSVVSLNVQPISRSVLYVVSYSQTE